jgi:hypothetical protein
MTNMKFFAASFVAGIFLAIALTCGQAFCADPFDVVDVYVSCSCQDAVGANLCLALKEKIKRSSNLRLVATENHTGGVALHLVCPKEAHQAFERQVPTRLPKWCSQCSPAIRSITSRWKS